MGVMERIHIEKGSSNTPLVSIIVTDSRSKTHPKWVDVCLASVRGQWFLDWELIVFDNTDKAFSIGKTWNMAAQYATADWILFLGDDDYIQPDYIQSLYRFALESDKNISNMAGVTSYGFLFNEAIEKLALLKKVPFGMMKKSKVLEIKFNEEKTKHVDVDFMERTGIAKAEGNIAIMFWNFGYFYRSHEEQASGRKEAWQKP